MGIHVRHGEALPFLLDAAAQSGQAEQQRADQQRQAEIDMRLLSLQEQQRQFDINAERSAIGDYRQDRRHDQDAQRAMQVAAIRDRRLLQQHANEQDFAVWKDQQDFAQQAAMAQFNQGAQDNRAAASQAGIDERMHFRDDSDTAEAMFKSAADSLNQYHPDEMTQQGRLEQARLQAKLQSARSAVARPHQRLDAAQQILKEIGAVNREAWVPPEQKPEDQWNAQKVDLGNGQYAVPARSWTKIDASPPNNKEPYQGIVPGLDFAGALRLRDSAHKELIREKAAATVGEGAPAAVTDDEIDARIQKILHSIGHQAPPEEKPAGKKKGGKQVTNAAGMTGILYDDGTVEFNE